MRAIYWEMAINTLARRGMREQSSGPLAVVPSTWHGEGPPFGWIEIAITAGFLGLFGLSYSLYASLSPKIPIREALVVGERTRGP